MPQKASATFRSRVLGTLIPPQMFEVVRGAGVAFVLKAAAAVLGFFFNIALARLVGAKGAGIYFLALTVTMFAAVLGRGGLDNVVLRFTAADASKGAWGAVRRLYARSMFYCLFFSGLAAILTALLADVLAVHLFSKPELAGPLRWMSLAVVPLALATLHSEMLRGLKKIAASLTVLGIGIPAISLVGLLLSGHALGVLGAVWSYTAAAAIMTATGFLLWRRIITARGGSESIEQERPIASAAVPLLFVSVTQLVLGWFSTLIVGVYSNSAEVGVYHVALQTASLTSFILMSVNIISAPIFSSLHSQGRMAELESIARRSVTLIIAFAGPILLIFMIFSSWIMGWFGERFMDGGHFLAIIAIGQFINAATGSVGYLLMMTGHERVLRNIVAIVALLALILNLVLVPALGALGAAIATSICLSIQNIICLLFVRRKLGIWVIPLLLRRQAGPLPVSHDIANKK